MFKRMIAALLGAAMTASCFGALGVSAAQEEEPLTGASIIDKLVLGDSESEAAHSFKETNTIAGVDDKLEAQYDDENGIHCGGGLGDGLTYRQMQIPPEGESGMIEFTIEADPGQVTYITLRTSGSQFGRGNLLMYGKDGDTSVLDAYSGREYSELYAGRYNEGPACYGRYYYATYKLPEGMVPADGKVTLSIWHKGDMDSYGTSTYKEVSQPSAYLYSIYSSTEPYFEPDDDYKGTGKAPEIVKSDNSDKDMTAYEYLQKEVSDMTDKVLSWQVYGEEWEKKKTDENAYFEGAVIRNTPISEADMTGEGDAVSRRYAQNAILHQNWSTMSNLMILANAYIFDFSGDKHNNPEILDRYFALLDFYQRAQDSKGGWCYFSTGEDKGKWLGVSLDGTGERLTGEYWPLMSLGADAMIESYIMLNNYVMNSNNQEIIDDYQSHLNEVIDGDLTGKNDRTRRDFYTDMFGRLRDRMANPLRGVGDFYAPTNRAGTANQDFGYAYNANLCVRLLASDGVNVNSEYKPEDDEQYLDMVRYKYGEMVDGEKWFSTENGLGLEGGASHGGWAGDYGTLLMKITNEYAECSPYMSEEAKELFTNQAYNAYESSKYFFYPAAKNDGTPTLAAECYASSRKDGYGLHSSYPIAGFTATELESPAALRYLQLYIEHDMGYNNTIRSDFEVTNSPHIYTNLVDAQNVLKYYKTVEEMTAQGKIEPLPMEDEHEDFAWYDADAHVIVFKNKGEKAYITMNFRRDNWSYNDYTRIHFTTDSEDRTAEVRSTHQGDVYTWQDSSHLTDGNKPYTHYRYNGYEEVKYGKYICGINNSKDDEAAGQQGTVYYADTVGVTKAKDLISGKVYESSDGGDISVAVEPRGAVVLEVLERADTEVVSTIYKSENTVLGFDSKRVRVGETVTAQPEFFDGYKTLEDGEKSVQALSDGENTIVYEYTPNSQPEFNEAVRETEPEQWQVYNYGTASGDVVFDENGEPSAISSSCDEGKGNLDKTFVYKEICGDFKMHVTLDSFDRTSTDKEYFSLLASDSLDFETANFFELRHFSNNNNILLVSHDSSQEASTTSYWAGDMNNKSVPIDFIIERRGDMIEYWYSVDGGATYEQTSKPRNIIAADAPMYIGAAMTCQSGEVNTAHFKNLTIEGNLVGKSIDIGDTVTIDFSAKDADGDELTCGYDIPDGADVEGGIVTFTPQYGGSFILSTEVRDGYHETPVTKTVKVNVSGGISIEIDGRPVKTDVAPYISNDRTLLPIRAVSERLGAEVSWVSETETAVIEKDGTRIELVKDSDTALVNGSEVKLEQPAVIVQGRVMVPIRFIAEQLGCDVSWDETDRKVSIASKE